MKAFRCNWIGKGRFGCGPRPKLALLTGSTGVGSRPHCPIAPLSQRLLKVVVLTRLIRVYTLPIIRPGRDQTRFP